MRRASNPNCRSSLRLDVIDWMDVHMLPNNTLRMRNNLAKDFGIGKSMKWKVLIDRSPDVQICTGVNKLTQSA